MGAAGYTPFMAQKAMREELEALFEGKTFNGQGGEKPLNFYEGDLPIDMGDDEDVDTMKAAAPFVVAEVTGGSIDDRNEPQMLQMMLTICTYDTDVQRQGKLDVINIIEDIIQHFCAFHVFGKRFAVTLPMDWAIQQDDTAPYYFGAVILTVTTPSMTSANDPNVEALI
jgi:hypothetical protein